MFGDVERVMKALVNLMLASTWGEAREVIEQYADVLLSEAFERNVPAILLLLRRYPEACAIVHQDRALLQRCRMLGLDAVFRELTPDQERLHVAPDQFPDFDQNQENIARYLGLPKHVVARLAEQLYSYLQRSPRLQQMLEAMFRQMARDDQPDRSYDDMFNELAHGNSALKSSINQIGFDTYAEDPDAFQPLLDLVQHTMIGALTQYVATPNWEASKDFLVAHPELLPGS